MTICVPWTHQHDPHPYRVADLAAPISSSSAAGVEQPWIQLTLRTAMHYRFAAPS